MLFPASNTPDFIQINFPEYISNVQEFQSTDFIQINYQSTDSGIKIDCRYEKKRLEKLNEIRSFYYDVKINAFELPLDFFANFDANIKDLITKTNYWVFKSNLKINPRIVTRGVKLFNFDFSLQSIYGSRF